MLWQSSKPKGGLDDPGYDLLQSSDFPFKLPLPEGLPPSVIIVRRAIVNPPVSAGAGFVARPLTCARTA